MYFNDNETEAIKEMIEYYDTSPRDSDLYEIVGALRFKTLADKFEKAKQIRMADKPTSEVGVN